MFRNQYVEFANRLTLLYLPLIAGSFGVATYIIFDMKSILLCILPACVFYALIGSFWMNHVILQMGPAHPEPVYQPHPVPQRPRPTEVGLRMWAHDTPYTATVARIPGDPDKLNALFFGLYDNGYYRTPFTVRHWVRMRKVMSETMFRRVQYAMVDEKYAEWKGGVIKNGCDLTHHGRHVLKTYCLTHHHPTLENETHFQ